MNKILLTGLAISWRVNYDEKGEAKGRHVAISADAMEVAPFGMRLGANVMMGAAMLEQVKVDETLFNNWVDTECQHIVKIFAQKASQLGLEVNVPDMFIPLREQLAKELKKFCENDMPRCHTFYLIKTLKPGETFIDDTHIELNDFESTCEGVVNTSSILPKVVVIKAD